MRKANVDVFKIDELDEQAQKRAIHYVFCTLQETRYRELAIKLIKQTDFEFEKLGNLWQGED